MTATVPQPVLKAKPETKQETEWTYSQQNKSITGKTLQLVLKSARNVSERLCGLEWERADGYAKSVDIWLYSRPSIQRVLCRTIILLADEFPACAFFDCGVPKCNAEVDILGWTQWAKQMLNPKVLCWQQNTLQMSEQNHGFWQLPNIHSSAVVTVPAPARSTVQEMILHSSTRSSDQKVRMKKKFKAKKNLGSPWEQHCWFRLFFFFFSAEMWQVSEELAGTSGFRACLWGSTGDNDRPRWLISPLTSLF